MLGTSVSNETRLRTVGDLVSVVIPTFCGATTLPELISRILKSEWWETDNEIILVDDGNTDDTWPVICAITASTPQVHGIRLARNFGQHAALLAGIRLARHDICVTLDDDLQNPPEEIGELLGALSNFDVVYGIPRNRKQTLLRKSLSRLSKLVLRYSLGYEHATSISSFRAFRTSLRNGFAENLGPGISLDSLLNWSTSRFGTVRVEHHERKSGRSNYSSRSLFRFLIDCATGYSVRPLRVATNIGLGTITISFCVFLWVLGRAMLFGSSVPGFPFLVALISMLSGTQLVLLGVLGQYIGHMHFRVMNRPTYVILEQTKAPRK